MQEEILPKETTAPAGAWFKSTYSGPSDACVEVSDCGQLVAFRDSKDLDGPQLDFPRATFASFISGVVAGDFGDINR